jgi:hypothetical protein
MQDIAMAAYRCIKVAYKSQKLEREEIAVAFLNQEALTASSGTISSKPSFLNESSSEGDGDGDNEPRRSGCIHKPSQKAASQLARDALNLKSKRKIKGHGSQVQNGRGITIT